MMRTLASALLILLTLALQAANGADVPTSLIPNGDFETAGKENQPKDWALKAGATWEKDGDGHFLRLKVQEAGQAVIVFRKVMLTPDIKALELKYRVRYEGIERGKQTWFDGRIMMDFKDDNGDNVKPGPAVPTFKGTSKGWVEKSQQFRVPEGAKSLEMLFSLFNAKAGQLDFDDVTLTAIPVEPLLAAEAEAQAKEAARIAALPKPKPKVAVPAADKLPKLLHVVGNQILNSSDEPVWLQGVAVPSLDWSAGGDNVLKSIDVATRDWKANCIRLPIKSNFWEGKGPYQRDRGMQYRQTVDDAVNACAGNGAYIVIDLHEYRAPTEKHAAFWKELAERYKNHPAVLFDLLNEPHGISWDVWRNGGRVTDKPKEGDVIAENKEKLKGFESIGMQKLVDTVRNGGAKNIVIAGGLDWAYDVSGILTGSALDDRGGNGVVYSVHVYPWKSDWQNKFVAVAAKHPLFLGEVGCDIERMSFIPPERHEDPYKWAPDMLGLIQKHKLNWTAWSFHTKASPRVLQDWDYTPTPFWGAFVKRALAGEQFEMKKMR